MPNQQPILIIASNNPLYCQQFVVFLRMYYNTLKNDKYFYKQKDFVDDKFHLHIDEKNAASLSFYIQHLPQTEQYVAIQLSVWGLEKLQISEISNAVIVIITDNFTEKINENKYLQNQFFLFSYHELLLNGKNLVCEIVENTGLKNVLKKTFDSEKAKSFSSVFVPVAHIVPATIQPLCATIYFELSIHYSVDLCLIDLNFCLFWKLMETNTNVVFIDKNNLFAPYKIIVEKYFPFLKYVVQQNLPKTIFENDLYFKDFAGFVEIKSKTKAQNSWNEAIHLDAAVQLLSDEFLLSIKQIKNNSESMSTFENDRNSDEILKYRLLFETKQNHLLRMKLDKYENSLTAKIKRQLKRYLGLLFRPNSTIVQQLRNVYELLRFALTKTGSKVLRVRVANILRRLFFFAEFRPFEFKYIADLNKKYFSSYHEMRTYIERKLDHQTPINHDEEKIKFSIVMPLYNPPVYFLKEAIQSIEMQLYKNWELCVADDASSPENVAIIKRFVKQNDKTKLYFRAENGHISKCTNDALAMATGDYIVFMDQDDLITKDCLLELAKYIQQNPTCDVLYSDEDKIDQARQFIGPHYKPDWSPDNLLSRNYFGHVVAMKRSLVEEIGGLRVGFEGSQDYDIILRATEKAKHVVHIAKVLYHWRIHELSVASGEDAKPYAYRAAKKALEETLTRRNLEGSVDYLYGFRGYKINFAVKNESLVSIIIPTKDQLNFVKTAIESIFDRTTYKNFEVILLDNNSSDQNFFDFVKASEKKYGDKFKYIKAAIPFNFSKLMNIGVAAAKGEYVCLLNNDTEVIHADWLYNMVAYAQQSHIGAVGAKLLYPDNTIQHAGVIVGLGGVAGHAFMGQDKNDPGYYNYIQTTNNFSAVTAACLLCRREVYEAVDGFDESFEVEFNDVDFCLRLIEKGYYNVYVSSVELYHYESVSRGHPLQNSVSYKRHIREMNQFKKKWDKYIKNDPCYNPNLNIGVNNFSINLFVKDEELKLENKEND